MTLRLLRHLLPPALGRVRRPEVLLAFAGAGVLMVLVSAPAAELAWHGAPLVSALGGPLGLAAVCSVVSLLLLLPTPLVSLAFRADDRLSGAWSLVAPLAGLPVPRAALLRAAAVVAAATDLPGWLALLWAVSIAAVAGSGGVAPVLGSVPFLLLVLAAWQVVLLGADAWMMRWLSARWRQRLPRLISLLVFGAVGWAALWLALALRGRDRLFASVGVWDRLEGLWNVAPVWPVFGTVAGTQGFWQDPSGATAWLAWAALLPALVLWLGPAAIHLGVSRGMLSLLAARGATQDPGAAPRQGVFRGLALLDRPDRVKVAAVLVTWAAVRGAGSLQPEIPLWILDVFGPVLAAAASVAFLRESLREVVLLRLPVDAAHHLRARATAAAALVLAALLPPALTVPSSGGGLAQLFPLAWGIFATVTAAWAGVAAAAALFPGSAAAASGLRALIGLFLLAAILAPLVAAGALQGAAQALWAAGIPLVATARLWRLACHHHRTLEDPEPPPRRGREVDFTVWLFLGTALVTPLVANGMDFLGIGGREGPPLVLFALMPCVLGGAALASGRLLPGKPSDLLPGVAVGGCLLALSVGYAHAARWVGLLDPLRQEGAGELVRLLADQPWAVAVAAMLAATLLPAAEELFFRGLLFPALAASEGRRSAFLGSSLAFALLHPLAHAPFTLAFGLAAAWLYERRGGLAAPIAAHVTCNGAIIATWMLQ